MSMIAASRAMPSMTPRHTAGADGPKSVRNVMIGRIGARLASRRLGGQPIGGRKDASEPPGDVIGDLLPALLRDDPMHALGELAEVGTRRGASVFREIAPVDDRRHHVIAGTSDEE